MTANIPGLDDLKSFAQSDQFKKILPYLLTGGAAAGAGALMTRKKKRGGGRFSHLTRVLGNALLAGGAAAGATGLARYGLDKLQSPATAAAPAINKPSDNALRDTMFGWPAAIASGAAGLTLTHKLPVIGADTKGRDSALEAIRRALVDGNEKHKFTTPGSFHDIDSVRQLSPKDLVKYLNLSQDANGTIAGQPAAGLANRAGLTLGDNSVRRAPLLRGQDIMDAFRNPKDTAQKAWVGTKKLFTTNPKDTYSAIAGSDKAKYALSQIKEKASLARRRGLGGTFGQTKGVGIRRAGVGTIAALLPSLAGAFMTEEENTQ